ncbi:MAG TPA: type II secretion system F family protein [Gemmatimonadaceae bacterium]
MTLIVLLAVFTATILLVLGLYTFINRDRLAETEATRERLRSMQMEGAETFRIMRDERRSAVPLIDMMLRDQPLAAKMEWELTRAGLKWSVGEFVLASLLSAIAALVTLQVFGLWVAGAAMVGACFAPWFYVRRARRKRDAKMEVQLPDAVDMIVNAMRAGFSLQAAMQFVGQEHPAPLGAEFFRYSEEQRLGVDARAALLDLEDRIGSLDAKMFVTSLLIQRETGGNLTDVLSGLASLIRERIALRDRVRTLTAEPRATAILLSLLPVLLFAGLFFMKRDFMMPLLTTTTGNWVLVYAGGSVILGYAILRKMANIEL